MKLWSPKYLILEFVSLVNELAFKGIKVAKVIEFCNIVARNWEAFSKNYTEVLRASILQDPGSNQISVFFG